MRGHTPPEATRRGRHGLCGPLAVVVALLLSEGVRPVSSAEPRPPFPPNTTWQSRPSFWRMAEVSWSPPDDAVYARRPARDDCHCGHLCLADTACPAAELVETAGGLSCQLASRRGNSSDNTAAVTAFVRRGHAALGERCLSDDECWQGLPGAGCVDGVCACAAAPLTARGDCIIGDCAELAALGVTASSRHWVRPVEGQPAAAVFCDMETDGGGWTVFQRRQNDSEQLDFYRYWHSYRDGFGDVSGQFWLGNELLHLLTTRRPHQLRIDMENFDGDRRFAQYDSFQLADEADNYRLSVSGFTGDAGDSLSYHNNRQFSTKDRDNDSWPFSCSRSFLGAWWYGSCHGSNLNGHYWRGTYTRYATGVAWAAWMGQYDSLKRIEMKTRPTEYAAAIAARGPSV